MCPFHGLFKFVVQVRVEALIFRHCWCCTSELSSVAHFPDGYMEMLFLSMSSVQRAGIEMEFLVYFLLLTLAKWDFLSMF